MHSSHDQPHADPAAPTHRPLLARFAAGLLERRLLVLLAALLITLPLGWQLSRVRMEWDEQAEIASSDAEFTAYKTFLERFGGEEVLVVALESDTVFTAPFLDMLRGLTEDLRDIPGAVDAVSLATIPTVRGDGGDLRIEPFLLDLPDHPEASARLRAEALADPLWAGTLVSADGRIACIHLLLPPMHADSVARINVVEAVEEAVARHVPADVKVAITGISPLARDALDTMARDLRRFLALTPPLILLLLVFAFRCLRGVLIPVLVIGLSAVWTLGLMTAFGTQLNYATVMLPTLLAVVSLSYIIHFLSAYFEAAARGGDPRERLLEAIVHIAPACFTAAFTTAIGFGALVVSDLRSIRELGIYASLGVMIAFVLCMTVAPAILSWLPPPPRAAAGHRHIRWLRRGLLRTAALVNGTRVAIPAAMVLLALLAAEGIRRVRVETQLFRILSESAPSIRGLRVVEANLTGFHTLDVMIDGDPGTFNEPWALAEIARVQRHAEGLDGVDRVLSLNTLLRRVHALRHPDTNDPRGLPESAAQVAEYRLLFSMSGQAHAWHALATPGADAARLAVRIPTMTTADHLRLIDAIESHAEEHLDPRLTLRTTGTLKILAIKLHAMVEGMLRSFGLSFALVALLLTLQLRSVKAGLVAMIPNVLPIAMGFGLMGFARVPLSAGTVTIPALGIGITVDHTIHFLLRYRRESRAGRAPAKAIRQTLLGAGRAMVFASCMLAAGFALLAFSGYRLNREFGLLTAFIMLAALLADLLVTPFVTRTFRLLPEEKTR